MVGYARKRLTRFDVPPSSADPEDVVQIALTKVLAHGKPVEDLRKYVFAVITNEVHHAARRYYTGQGYGSLDTDLRLENAGPAVDPCAAADLRLDVQAAMNSLPPRQRSVMSYRVQGYTQEETAAAMGTAPGTVAAHVSRALLTLKVTLGVLSVLLTGFSTALLWRHIYLVSPASGGPKTPSWQTMGAEVLSAVVSALAVTAAYWTAGQVRQLRDVRKPRRVRLDGAEELFGMASGDPEQQYTSATSAPGWEAVAMTDGQAGAQLLG